MIRAALPDAQCVDCRFVRIDARIRCVGVVGRSGYVQNGADLLRRMPLREELPDCAPVVCVDAVGGDQRLAHLLCRYAGETCGPGERSRVLVGGQDDVIHGCGHGGSSSHAVDGRLREGVEQFARVHLGEDRGSLGHGGKDQRVLLLVGSAGGGELGGDLRALALVHVHGGVQLLDVVDVIEDVFAALALCVCELLVGLGGQLREGDVSEGFTHLAVVLFAEPCLVAVRAHALGLHPVELALAILALAEKLHGGGVPAGIGYVVLHDFSPFSLLTFHTGRVILFMSPGEGVGL